MCSERSKGAQMDEPRIRMESDNKNAECKKAAGDQLKAKENE